MKTRTLTLILFAALGTGCNCGADPVEAETPDGGGSDAAGNDGLDAGAGDGGDDGDAGEDAGETDAGTDSGVPAIPASLSVHEVSIQGQPVAGQGPLVGILFLRTPRLPDFEASGCRVWELSAAEAGDVGVDEGPVEITASDGSPVIPPCLFSASAGYVCIAATGSDGSFATGGFPGVYTFTQSQPIFSPDDRGRLLEVQGAPDPTMNGSFPIIAFVSPNTVAIASGSTINPGPISPGTWTTIAGQGPTPGIADPGLLEDDDLLTFDHAGVDGGRFPASSEQVDVGDDFDLDTESQQTIAGIPTDGGTFALRCPSATCGTADRSRMLLTTTDTPIPSGAPAFVFPAPTALQVLVECTSPQTSVDVPASVSAYIATSGATRIRTAFARENVSVVQNAGPPPTHAEVVAGHAIVGFTTP